MHGNDVDEMTNVTHEAKHACIVLSNYKVGLLKLARSMNIGYKYALSNAI